MPMIISNMATGRPLVFNVLSKSMICVHHASFPFHYIRAYAWYALRKSTVFGRVRQKPVGKERTLRTMEVMSGVQWTVPMDEALALGRRAGDAGEVPVGAVVLGADGEVIGRGRNRRETLGDPLAHAEIEAMREAAMLRSKAAACHNVDGLGFDNGDMAQSSAGGASDLTTPSRSGSWNLQDCTLLVTLEPCPMCAGAALQAHIGRIVFGAWDAKLGACGSVWDIPRDPHVGARPEVVGGVCEADCAGVLTDFFAARR
jgi:tRNA(adenine34) deaminase